MIRPEAPEDFILIGCAKGRKVKPGEMGIKCWREREAPKERGNMKAIADGRKWIDAYLEKKDAELSEVGQGLRRLMKKTVPGTKESVNPWKLPTFESNGPVCYFSIGKNHVTFGFLRGTSLPDPAKLLEGTGKGLRHVKLHSVDDLRKPALKKLIQAAARLNKKEPMEGMKSKKKAN